jgi:hypothetical protein
MGTALGDDGARMRRSPFLLLFIALLGPGCAEHLPDQDLRILTTPPAAKLSSDDLWKDFQKDPAAARAQYFGKAVDVSGRVTSIEADPAKTPNIFFAQPGDRGVRARLLDERAAETARDVKAGDRITLRCFCEGLDEKQDVLLKSCIKP